MDDPSVSAAARQAIYDHWDGKLPVDPVKIAVSMGIQVVEHDFSDETVTQALSLDGIPTIRISRASLKGEPLRARFAMAHAIGHIALHGRDLPTECSRPLARSEYR